MGMDVYGRKPTSPAGEYFRRTIWGWHPLAGLVTSLHPNLTVPCRHWHTNDGDGLKARASARLAAALQHDLQSGRVRQAIMERDQAVAAIPRPSCSICEGSGIRTDAIGLQHNMLSRIIGPPAHAPGAHPRFGQTGWCNACDGWGSTPPVEASFSLNEADVRDFAEFLAACGGFEIC